MIVWEAGHQVPGGLEKEVPHQVLVWGVVLVLG